MVLGIAVAYMCDSHTDWLLDIHLQQIERNTTVPFTIYGSVNRLAPSYTRRLEASPHVKICPIPDTDKRGTLEHSYYLDHLVGAAIADGATHVVTMHLDSFPIRPGWAEELAARLDEGYVIATLDTTHTACLFFSREFYVECRPVFFPPDDQRGSREYQQYLLTCSHGPYHSGVGYGFAAHLQQRKVYYQTRALLEAPFGDFGQVFDATIFHLVGAVWFAERWAGRRETPATRYGRLLEALATVYQSAIPWAARRFVRQRLRKPLARLVDQPRTGLFLEREHAQYEAMRQALLNDWPALLQRMSAGKTGTWNGRPRLP
jgi:hypothetical protein